MEVCLKSFVRLKEDEVVVLRCGYSQINDRSRLRQYSPSRLQNAFQAVKDDGMSVHKASKVYNVPLTTLRDRVDGKIYIGPAPILSQEEEIKLVQHIKKMAAYGYGYSRTEMINIASDYAVFCQKRTTDQPLSSRWYYNFMSRWGNEVKLVKPRALEAARAYAATKEKVENYFEELNKTKNKYNLTNKPQCIFNVDEKGINTDHKLSEVVGDKDSKAQSITSGRSETVTVIGGGNALGIHIPPFFIFKGQRMREELLEGGLPGTDGVVSPTGWSNAEIFRRYLKEHFIKFIPNRDASCLILVVYDGHGSHCSIELIEWAEDNHIIIQVLPAHCSHFLQPLDVSCFGPFEKVYNRECQKFLRENIGRLITRNEVCSLASTAYLKSVTTANLISGFRRTGIYPLNADAYDLSVITGHLPN